MRPISATHYQVRIPAHFAKLAEPIMDKAGIRNFPDFVRQAVMNQIRAEESQAINFATAAAQEPEGTK
jgi:hypothetical protein